MNLVILYGIGGLSDVGRHAILAALETRNEPPTIEKITVITEYPEKLNEKNWDSGSRPEGHSNPFDDPRNASRLEMVKIDDAWKDDRPDLSEHFRGDSSAVVSCLGHRQPGWKHPELRRRGLVARDGNRRVIAAMEEAKVDRVVTISSVGVNGDRSWPHPASKFMACLFRTFMRKAGKDLKAMEDAYARSSLDYLIVRPVGIGEDVAEAGRYYLQVPGEDAVGGSMAKMDVARFMIDEAVRPTLHRCSQTVGSKHGTPM